MCTSVLRISSVCSYCQSVMLFVSICLLQFSMVGTHASC
uniref:Uncharacterized protein n=1 Tax=Arundo donax TaxID=35708 RepID=A0A0A9BY09_ARUDO